MKNAVLLAPYFLPRRRVGAWRPFTFAVHLRAFGWQPHIITLKTPGGELTAKEEALLADIPVYEMHPFVDLTGRLDQKQQKRHSDNQTADALKKWPTSLLGTFDKHFPVDTWLPLFWYHRKKIEQYMHTISPDLLWSTGDPWSAHWLAGTLADSLDLPWVADFRDPWTLGGVNLKERSGFSHRVDRHYEKKVVSDASICTFTARATEQLYAEHYELAAQQTATVFNCFDPLLYNPPKSDEALFDNDFLNLLFFGRFRRLSPAQPLIEVLAHLYTEAPEAAKRVRIYSFGPLNRQEYALANARGVMDNFKFFEHIAAEDALTYLSKADILWLSTHPERKHIIPAKLWDYLAARRPVLSVCPNPEIENILQQAGGGIQLPLVDYDAIADVLVKSVKAKQNNEAMPIPVAFDDAAIQQFGAEAATKKLAGIFDELV